MCQTMIEIVPGQVTGGAYDVRRGASGLGPHVGEQLGQVVRAQAGEELPDRQVVDEGAGGEIPVARGGAVGECLRQESGITQPPRGPPVEFRLQAGQTYAQMGPEYLPEQRVELVRGVPEILDERVVAVQPGENGLGIGPEGQRVGQIGEKRSSTLTRSRRPWVSSGCPLRTSASRKSATVLRSASNSFR